MTNDFHDHIIHRSKDIFLNHVKQFLIIQVNLLLKPFSFKSQSPVRAS